MMTQATTPSKIDGLWDRIESFDIDGGPAAFPFAVRLARENGWTEAFARRAIMEYRRFVFLAMTAGHPVTPSDQVDQVWHLHLTYTRSYWQRLCGDVLPRPLHHDPTRGGDSENQKFDDWYARTRESYERAFGEAPPIDLWPDPDVRFGDDLHYERVNTLHHFVIPRRVAGRLVRFGVVAGGTLLLVAGCTPVVLGATDEWRVIAIVGGVLLLFMLVLWAARRYSQSHASGCGGSGCGGGIWWFGAGCGTHRDSGPDGSGHGGSDHGDSSGFDSGGGDGGGCGGGGCGGGGD